MGARIHPVAAHFVKRGDFVHFEGRWREVVGRTVPADGVVGLHLEGCAAAPVFFPGEEVVAMVQRGDYRPAAGHEVAQRTEAAQIVASALGLHTVAPDGGAVLANVIIDAAEPLARWLATGERS